MLKTSMIEKMIFLVNSCINSTSGCKVIVNKPSNHYLSSSVRGTLDLARPPERTGSIEASNRYHEVKPRDSNPLAVLNFSCFMITQLDDHYFLSFLQFVYI